jgi:hypothetical protein
MTTTQTVSKQMPEGLLADIKQYMEENDVSRVDVRRSGTADEPEGDGSTYRYVMSDDELPEDSSLHHGAFITATVTETDA